jgi:beta-N-acetylhexosaminidase
VHVLALLAALALAPPIAWKPVPFGSQRVADTAAYSQRHYGQSTWRLTSPKVIVHHYTANTSLSATWNAFASNAPDPELHERPGTCAHFVVDRDGRIYQLVRLSIRCRHTVGLNWTAIGVEHVGTSDASVMSNARQLRASLRLSAWLMSRYGIDLGDVIGHNESLTSPYRRERYAAWRCQTHGDFRRATMDRYRARLAREATSAGVSLGRRVHRVRSACR